jgi:uncharacterized protein
LEIEELSMNPQSEATSIIAFEGNRRIAAGELRDVVRAAKETLERRKDASILVFDGNTGGAIDIDFRGTIADVLARLPQEAAVAPDLESPLEDPLENAEPEPTPSRGRGRPKLGVVAREITLLPRHWDWLARQSGGASVAIRKLVEEARRSGEDNDRIRLAQEAAYRFMSAMAGNAPHYEDAIRALFANDRTGFEKLIADWPEDVRDQSLELAGRAFRRNPQVRAG